MHHGLDPSRYHPMPDQGYLLFLGRYDRVKGCVHAIEVAVRAGLPLVMAGRPARRRLLRREVKPLIERHGVLELGPVGGARKSALIARARALLFPIEWEEPFGLVMIEAMLSGVPVIGHARGAVPEVVDDGITGVVCDDASEMVAAVRIADKLFKPGAHPRGGGAALVVGDGWPTSTSPSTAPCRRAVRARRKRTPEPPRKASVD